MHPRLRLNARAATALLAMAFLGALAFLPQSALAARMTGTCQLTGELRFDRKIGNLPRAAGFTDRASGTCSGLLNGVAQTNTPVKLRGKGSGTLSCLFARGTSKGTLTFTRGTKKKRDDLKIRYIAESVGGATQMVASVRGTKSGHGIAHVSFLAYGDQATLERCNAGKQRSTRYDMTSVTIDQLVG